MLTYFDAHCHFLSASTFVPNNVGAINNSTQLSDWKSVINSVQENPNVYGAIGVHPWYVSDLSMNWDTQLYEMLVRYSNLTVGEIGLDVKRPDMDTQIKIFVRQLELANMLKRGVHIHCVGAWDIMKKILKSHKVISLPFVLFHRFNGAISDWAEMQNVYFSYSPTNNFRRILLTLQNRLLLETDSDNISDIIAWADKVETECNISKEVFVNNALRMLNNG